MALQAALGFIALGVGVLASRSLLAVVRRATRMLPGVRKRAPSLRHGYFPACVSNG